MTLERRNNIYYDATMPNVDPMMDGCFFGLERMDGDTLALQPAWQASLSDVSVQLFKGGVVKVLSLAKMYIGVQGRVGSV